MQGTPSRRITAGAMWLLALQLPHGYAHAYQSPKATATTQHLSQPAFDSQASTVDAPGSSDSIIPEGTSVIIELTEALSSSTHQRGDRFKLQLAEPLVIDGQQVLAAGMIGAGEVVHAAAARSGGAAGELLLAARSLQCDGQTIALRGFKLGATGKDRRVSAIGVATLGGPLGMFVRGGHVEIPAGTRGTAKLAAAIPHAICATQSFPSTTP